MTALTADGQLLLTRGDGTQLLAGTGTVYKLTDWDPHDQRDQRNADQPNPSGGDWPGLDVGGGRTFTAKIHLTRWRLNNPSAIADAETDRRTLVAACAEGTDEATLDWQEGGGVQYRSYVRCRGVDTTQGKVWWKELAATWRVPDGLCYSTTENHYPTVDGTVTAHNNGVLPTIDWRFVVAGPFTGGRLAYNVTGTQVNVIRVPAIASGHHLEIVARRDEIRDVVTSTGAFVGIGGRCTDDAGLFAELLPVWADPDGSAFIWSADTGTADGDAYLRGCFPP